MLFYRAQFLSISSLSLYREPSLPRFNILSVMGYVSVTQPYILQYNIRVQIFMRVMDGTDRIEAFLNRPGAKPLLNYYVFHFLWIILEKSYNLLNHRRFGIMAENWVMNWQPCLFLCFAVGCLTRSLVLLQN